MLEQVHDEVISQLSVVELTNTSSTSRMGHSFSKRGTISAWLCCLLLSVAVYKEIKLILKKVEFSLLVQFWFKPVLVTHVASLVKLISHPALSPTCKHNHFAHVSMDANNSIK